MGASLCKIANAGPLRIRNSECGIRSERGPWIPSLRIPHSDFRIGSADTLRSHETVSHGARKKAGSSKEKTLPEHGGEKAVFMAVEATRMNPVFLAGNSTLGRNQRLSNFASGAVIGVQSHVFRGQIGGPESRLGLAFAKTEHDRSIVLIAYRFGHRGVIE